MAYNISEVTGFVGSGTANVDIWTRTVDLSHPGNEIITGNFNRADVGGGGSGEAASYSFSTLSTPYGTLSYNTTNGQFTFTVNRAALLASGSDQVITFTVTGRTGGSSDTDTVIINLLICVARGTMIATPQGARPVEDLLIGDEVLTADGRTEAIRWIGSRRVGADELARDPSLRPIRIRRDALGAGLPEADLHVSPQHRVRIADARAELLFGMSEVLAPAKGLVNDASVSVDYAVEEVEYFHVAFEQHEIMITNGLATESFHPGATSLREIDRAAAEELLRIFPRLKDDPEAFGPSALPSLKPWEAKLLSRVIKAK